MMCQKHHNADNLEAHMMTGELGGENIPSDDDAHSKDVYHEMR